MTQPVGNLEVGEFEADLCDHGGFVNAKLILFFMAQVLLPVVMFFFLRGLGL